MEIIPIFDEESRPLSSSCYEEDDKDEYTKLFENWQNPEFLESFFNENKTDLENYNKNVAKRDISIKEAIEKTIIEAKLLEKKLLELSENSIKGNISDLDSMFFKLNKYKEYELIPQKAYGETWLRIYAIQLESNVYVITGGMIKLTLEMKDSDCGRTELIKINRTKSYLKELGCTDLDGLKEN